MKNTFSLQIKPLTRLASPLIALALLGAATVLSAREPFTNVELEEADQKLTASAKRGYDMWYGARADMANNGLACANCHPDAAATNPQTFPKFMTQTGAIMAFRDMINWCIENPQGGKQLDAKSVDMIALESYAYYLHRGVPIDTGMMTRQTSGPEVKTARGLNVKGTGIGFDK
jgi:thiosulfate dehydrogenase